MCALARVRRARKVNGRQLHAALCHHPRRHRAVEAAADENGRLAARTHRNAARAGLRLAVDIRRFLADFHAHRDLRVMHVYGNVRVRAQQRRAHLAGDFHGAERELLVRTLRFHLERLKARKCVIEVFRRHFCNGVHILFTHASARIADDAENLRDALLGLVNVRVLVLRFNVNGGLHRVHLKVARAHNAAANVL